MIEITKAGRPDDRRGEDEHFARVFREALVECSLLLNMPGSPNLLDVPKVLRERMVVDYHLVDPPAFLPYSAGLYDGDE